MKFLQRDCPVPLHDTYPDVCGAQVEGLKQEVSGSNPEPVIKNTWDGLVSISRVHGVRALFAGISINFLKVVPSTAIGFALYDALKSYLGLPSNL